MLDGEQVYLHAERAMDDDRIAYLPTAEEIAAACREVQVTWGPKEERKRRGWTLPPPVETWDVGGIGEPAE